MNKETTVYRWVKASERQPKNSDLVHVIYGKNQKKEMYKDVAYFENEQWLFASNDKSVHPLFLKDLEWLEEVPLLSLSPLKEAVQTFEEWRKESENNWELSDTASNSKFYDGKEVAYADCRDYLTSLITGNADLVASDNAMSEVPCDAPLKSSNSIKQEQSEWINSFWSFIHLTESKEGTTVSRECGLQWIDEHVVKPLEEKLRVL